MFDDETYRVSTASRGTVLLPLSAGLIQGGVWLYGAVRPSMVAVQTLNGWLVGRSIHLTPGHNTKWVPPIAVDHLDTWLGEVEEALEERIAHVVGQLPRDRRRRRFNLLLTDSSRRPVGFAKFTMNPPNTTAVAALRRFAETPPTTYWAPQLITNGVLDSYSYTVASPMPNRAHRPAKLSPERRRDLVVDIQDRLRELVKEPQVPTHGDFGAWNVRSFRDGSMAIVDWEDAGRGVPAADELWHVLSWQANAGRDFDVWQLIRGELPHHDPHVVSEAARYLIRTLNRPEPPEVNPQVARSAHVEQATVGVRRALEVLSDGVL